VGVRPGARTDGRARRLTVTLAHLHAYTGRHPPGDHTYRLWLDGVGWLRASAPGTAWLR
jgi:hypothetical protein